MQMIKFNTLDFTSWDINACRGRHKPETLRYKINSDVPGLLTGDRQVLLSINDDGPGIPPNHRTALIARHGRADESGTGLGLAIAGEIAESVGGRLTLSDAKPGLTATLALP